MIVKYIDRRLTNTVEFYDVDFLIREKKVTLRVQSEKGKIIRWEFSDLPPIDVWLMTHNERKEIDSILNDEFEL